MVDVFIQNLKFSLIISGRDWCNLFEEISQEQIDQMQEKAMQNEQ